MNKSYTVNKSLRLFIYCLLTVFTQSVFCQDQPPSAEKAVEAQATEAEAEIKVDPTQNTLETLESFVALETSLQKDIKAINKQIKAAQTDQEKADLAKQLEKLKENLSKTSKHMREISAGVDISSLHPQQEEAFDIQAEVFSLLKPAIDEMKDMTASVRQKSILKENIQYFTARLDVIEKAIQHVTELEKKSKNKKLSQALKNIKSNWEKNQSISKSELQANQLQLEKLEAAEIALAESSGNYLKSFFQKRGLYLSEAIVIIIVIILISKVSLNSMHRHLPGFRAEHRSFRIRLIELIHRIVTLLLLILGPMAVFYLVEDWVLFSLGILILFGVAWTLRQALPRYWQQIYLFLNIGSVREGDRILMQGLPWRVQKINMYSTLENPVAGIKLRLPIIDLVGQNSRPAEADEPWFPCKKNDWVMLDDGTRGKVTGISLELVQLSQRGGVKKTYQTSDFLASSPRNLSTNFRIKETIGLSYKLQPQISSSILETLYAYIQQKAEQEGYKGQLLNLRVEFESAADSSLNLVVIADFDGELAELYNRLRRAIQRWCVDACTENNWEIPFPQLTVHKE